MKRHALSVGVDQYSDASSRDLRHSMSDAAALAGAFGRPGYDSHELTNPNIGRTIRRFALFVGINAYGGKHNLRCARADAEILYDEFSRYYDETRLLVDKDASRQKIMAAVVEFRKLMRPGDMFLFFFAGHGGDFDGERLLELSDYDAQGHRIGLTNLLTSELRGETDVRGLHRLFILDCCRKKQSFGRNAHERPEKATRTRGFIDRHGPDSITPPTILSSSSPGQSSYENDSTGHGYFTEAFLKTLRDKSVCNFNDFRDHLDAVMTNMDVPGNQLPYFEGPIGSDFPFWPEWDSVGNGGSGDSEEGGEEEDNEDFLGEVDDDLFERMNALEEKVKAARETVKQLREAVKGLA